MYKQVKQLRKYSSFEWDKDKHILTAEPEVWDNIRRVGSCKQYNSI